MSYIIRTFSALPALNGASTFPDICGDRKKASAQEKAATAATRHVDIMMRSSNGVDKWALRPEECEEANGGSRAQGVFSSVYRTPRWDNIYNTAFSVRRTISGILISKQLSGVVLI